MARKKRNPVWGVLFGGAPEELRPPRGMKEEPQEEEDETHGVGGLYYHWVPGRSLLPYDVPFGKARKPVGRPLSARKQTHAEFLKKRQQARANNPEKHRSHYKKYKKQFIEKYGKEVWDARARAYKADFDRRQKEYRDKGETKPPGRYSAAGRRNPDAPGKDPAAAVPASSAFVPLLQDGCPASDRSAMGFVVEGTGATSG